jgi:RNA polymerase sigma-70 factor, ECF subfamily
VSALAMPTGIPQAQRFATDDFDSFYAASVQRLTLQLYAYLGDLAEAQDVVQEAYYRALLKWKRISTYDDPVAWVRRVAWNLATNHFRKQRNALNFLRRHSSREETVAGPGPDRVALTRALATLPPHHRRAVILHYQAQMTISEIAVQEGVAEGTVKSWLSRGRAALAGQLRKES